MATPARLSAIVRITMDLRPWLTYALKMISAAATKPATTMTVRSSGCHDGSLSRRTADHADVASTVAAIANRAQRAERRDQRIHDPIPTTAAMEGARATV
jgi:hypothetical protein